ncbi:uncharacterized protein BDR25DRAFT_341086 [Lindgomyces ingoldianus]|uniref:Uncharacterized protein n=1 Tax=Lindgomyces ingoldianus TaxID=673940 RepID=A0ACB6R5V0_9PLEO|nr:uncharacterized protein BDR25DRAFT_341086 [Lindgomyces ingoldianus]KAF2473826.1 hypothetical protein BDR25DRAFT_341086 [Lindgomyces ingoldianus]
MFASLLRTQNGPRSERTPLLAAFNLYRNRREAHPDNERSVSDDDNDDDYAAQHDGEEDNEDTYGHVRNDGPLLPVFSEFLDRLPIYNTTHSIRIIVIQRCETTLSWEQLRSPQVSQFLIKPIQQQILSDHFSRGTLYCLLANCLQFRKEGESNPGNVGVSRSRALICELLAMRLLKEFSTRELIDALSYDFDPLQGLAPAAAGTATPGGNRPRSGPRSARISTLEISIRAQAKKFLAHPLVVQQLEAIWAGTIVFHSAADSLHRQPALGQHMPEQHRLYNAINADVSPGRGPSRRPSSAKQETTRRSLPGFPIVRRTVTLYDPHDASLFKLSRLRVPRYRQMFTTVSYAIMLGLFVAVLREKSDDITALEVLFWFWSAGYMLDEIVGFSEQGFGLYIMSVWNAFDLGILLMFMVYYILRLYGILMPDVRRHYIASMAYDVLGSTAVLLFPRLFSALDHYRYFSQLLIAFRMMAMDLVAILLLIVISCSGFFVAFTMSFKKDLDAPSAAYALFQMLMGFTPAAWEIWGDYNPLGQTLLTLFLFICHFLIVTILITVLTNSFMAIVQNGNEEHQFLFAVNTISMVKSDALFSYIAPTNILGWLVIPMKYCMSFRRFIRMNRLIIKVTHIPILFSIFLYERLLLSNFAYGPTDLVEQRGRAHSKLPAFTLRGPTDVFSPGTRLREPSITTFHKDRALEEVFRRPFRDPTLNGTSEQLPSRRNSSNVVTDWMKGVGDGGEALPPLEDTRSVLDRLETRKRPRLRRTMTAGHTQYRRKHPLAMTRSVASDPDNNINTFDRHFSIAEEEEPDMSMEDLPQQTDADGDDELVTNEDDDRVPSDHVAGQTNEELDKENKHVVSYETSEEEYFRTPMTVKPRTPKMGSSLSSAGLPHGTATSQRPPTRTKPGHSRNLSTNTVLFSPSKETMEQMSRSTSPSRAPPAGTRSGTVTPGRIVTDGRRTPKRLALSGVPTTRPRPIMPPHNLNRSTPNIASFLALDQRRRDPSFNAVALDLASDLGDNRHGPDYGALGALPASFTTQLEMAARARAREGGDEESNRMSRIMLARMTTLEEGFRDVLKEVKGLKKGSEDGGPSRDGSKGHSATEEHSKKKGKGKRRNDRRGKGEERMGSSV